MRLNMPPLPLECSGRYQCSCVLPPPLPACRQVWVAPALSASVWQELEGRLFVVAKRSGGQVMQAMFLGELATVDVPMYVSWPAHMLGKRWLPPMHPAEVAVYHVPVCGMHAFGSLDVWQQEAAGQDSSKWLYASLRRWSSLAAEFGIAEGHLRHQGLVAGEDKRFNGEPVAASTLMLLFLLVLWAGPRFMQKNEASSLECLDGLVCKACVSGSFRVCGAFVGIELGRVSTDLFDDGSGWSPSRVVVALGVDGALRGDPGEPSAKQLIGFLTGIASLLEASFLVLELPQSLLDVPGALQRSRKRRAPVDPDLASELSGISTMGWCRSEKQLQQVVKNMKINPPHDQHEDHGHRAATLLDRMPRGDARLHR